MWSYIVRRLLLMIPTLFGVTVVSFVIMQLAPGDPLLAQVDSGGNAGQSSQTREAYLLQKRDLNLDKPILLNFGDFHDFRPSLKSAAWFLARPPAEIEAELAALAGGARDEPQRARLTFLRSLAIKDFDPRLTDPEQRPALAVAVLAYVRVYCEDNGARAVPAAMYILRSDAEPREKIGAIRALESMVPAPFEYTFSRTPQPDEAPPVEATWRIWWQRNKDKFEPLDPDRSTALAEQMKVLVAEPSRERLYEELGNFDRDDSPFFAGVLLGDSQTGGAPLAEKAIAAMVLLAANGKPLKVDVPLDAGPDEIERVSENWLAYYQTNLDEYQPGTPRKLWNIVADTQYAHMVWRLATFNFGRSALKSRDPVSGMLWRAFVVSGPLMFMAELVIYFLAVPLGIVCGVNRGTFVDRSISLGLFVLYSIPAFVAGMLLLLFLCYGRYLKIFPMERLHSQGAESFDLLTYLADYFWHATLPVICLSLFSLAAVAMYARSAILDVINQDYVRTAWAKGVAPMRVVLKHVVRNGLIPIITLFASFLPAMLGGSVLVEYLFNIQGLGKLGFDSIAQKDIPTVMALIYIDAIVTLVSILICDLLYVVVDPRITFDDQGASA